MGRPVPPQREGNPGYPAVAGPLRHFRPIPIGLGVYHLQTDIVQKCFGFGPDLFAVAANLKRGQDMQPLPARRLAETEDGLGASRPRISFTASTTVENTTPGQGAR